MDTNEANGIYAFGLPNVAENVRFTCVFCGGPAISEIEIDDEIICDCCYQKNNMHRENADDQYCFWKKCEHRNDFLYDCDGRCARCVL